MSILGHRGLLMGASGTPWTPANLTVPPTDWLNDDGAVTDAGSGRCSLWTANLGTNGIQGTSANRPLIAAAALNGRRGITFAGPSHPEFMTAFSTAIYQNVATGWWAGVWNRTVSTGGGTTRNLMVSRTNSATQNRFAVFCDATGGPDCVALQSRRLDADSTSTMNGTIPVNSGPHMVLCTIDWANRTGRIYVDGVLDVTNTTFTSAGATTSNTGAAAGAIMATNSGTNPTDGTMYESVGGGAATLPSAGEIDKIFGYLAHRWGLTGNLDVSHPYKSAPPYV